MTGASKNKGCAKQNAVLGHSRTPKQENFFSLKINYLNTSRKHRTITVIST
jgi:hypothetical protein